MDVKFLKSEGKNGKAVQRCQYTDIDDATRIRALKIHGRRNQANTIDVIHAVIAKFPFGIREVRPDYGHEFEAKFHRRAEGQGIRQACIRAASPHLNGKADRSHRPDDQEFHQHRSRAGDFDL